VTKHLQTIKRKMLRDPEVRLAYEALRDEFDRGRKIDRRTSARRTLERGA
jgi:hypothetical protein